MSKARSTGNIGNIVKASVTGVTISDGTNDLLSISSNGDLSVVGNINASTLDGIDGASFLQTGSFNSFSSSIDTTIKNKLNTDGVISGSAQIDITTSTGYSTFSSSLSSSIGSLSGSVATTTNNLSGRITTVEGNYSTTGSNIFVGSQTITGSICSTDSIVTTGQIVAQTINVQQVTSSIVYSCGSNVFGTDINNTQQFTGSMFITGSNIRANVGNTCFQGSVCAPVGIFSGCVGIGTVSPVAQLQIVRDGVGSSNTSLDGSQLILSRTNGSTENIAFRNTGACNGISGTNYAGQIVSYGNNILEIYTNVTNPIIFGTDATERMRITPSGSIEIGTTGISSPSGADRFIGVYGTQDSSLILQDNVQTWELYVNDDFYINRGSTNVLTLNRTTGTATFSSNCGIRVGSTDGGRVFIRQSAGGDAEIGATANGGLFLYANNVLGLSFNGAAATFSSTVQSIGVLSAGNTGATTGQIIVESGANAASRRWKLLTSQNVNGDFVIQQSTTQTGSTFADILGFNATGAATFNSSITAGSNINVSGEGTYIGIDAQATPRLGFVKVSGAQPFLAFAADSFTIRVSNGSNIATSNTFTPVLTLTTSGAATFSSSVTASGDITSSNGKFFVVNTYGYFFGSNSNLTGWQGSNGTQIIQGFTGGTEKMRIFSDGNIAIQDGGTFTNNGARLQVSGTATVSGQITGPSGGNEGKFNFIGYNNAYGGITANTGFNTNYNAVSIYSNFNSTRNGQGNTTNPSWILDLGGSIPDPDSFGIFRSPAGSFSFSNLFKVASTGAATFSSSVAAGGTISYTGLSNAFAAINGTTGYVYQYFLNTGGSFYLGIERSTSGGLMTNSSAYATVFTTNNATNLEFGTNGTKRLTITSGGNTGIGTDIPDTYSYGGARSFLTFKANGTNQEPFLQLIADGIGNSIIDFGNTTIRRASIIGFDGSSLGFFTNGTNSGTSLLERMRITSGGAMFNKASTAGHTAFIGAIGPGNVGNRYLHVRINTINQMMVWIKVLGFSYGAGLIEGLGTGYVDGGTGTIAQNYNSGSISIIYQNSNYIEVVVDTIGTGTTNRWGSISFIGGTDSITTIQPLEIIAYSWTSTTTRVY